MPLSTPRISALAVRSRPLREGLAAIAALPCREIEIALFDDWTEITPAALATDRSAAVHLTEAVNEAGLSVASLNVGLDDALEHELAMSRLEAVLTFAEAVGARSVTIQAPPAEEDFEAAVAYMTRALAIARGHRVALAVETHIGQLTEDPQVACRLLDEVPDLRLTYDPSHYMVMHGSLGPLAKFLPKINTVHCRDASRSEKELQVPIGRGEIDWERLIDLLAGQQHQIGLVVEYMDFDGKRDTLTEARDAARWVQGQMAARDAIVDLASISDEG